MAAFLTLLLPETLNKGLPDTVTQANRSGEEREKRKKNCQLEAHLFPYYT